jgi:hypothetical protein
LAIVDPADIEELGDQVGAIQAASGEEKFSLSSRAWHEGRVASA